MKKFFSSMVLVASLVVSLVAANLPSTHVVSAKWLADNLGSVVVVDVSSPKIYTKAHIPGSVNIPKKAFFKGHAGSIKALLDTPEQVQMLFRNAGISNDSTVIFVGHVKKAKKFTDMTRGAWTAYVYGLKNVGILDGGIEAWVSAGNKLTSKKTMVAKGNFTPKSFDRSSVASLVDVKGALVNKAPQIVDAREMKHFVGKDKDKRLKRHGHIPGAKKVSAYLFAKKDGKVFKLVSPAEAKKMFADAGVSVDKPIILYCNTGHLATGTWFVGKFLAGAKNIADFDGSMYQYSRTSLPVATGK